MTLSNCCSIFDGIHQTPRYVKEGILFYSAEDINKESNKKYISKSDYINLFSNKFCEIGDILMTRIGNIGESMVAEKNNIGYYVTLALIKPNSINNYFLKYYMDSQIFQKELWKRTLHVAFPKKINLLEIKNSVINIPNDIEQEKIGLFLKNIDDLIKTQSKIIVTLESYLSIMRENLFKTYKGNYYYFKDLYIKAKEGGTPNTKISNYYSNSIKGIPFIKLDNLNDKYIYYSNEYLSIKGLENSSAWIVPSNSLLLSNGGTIGLLAINKIPISTKQGIISIVPNDIVSTEFLYQLLNTKKFRNDLRKITTKGTMNCVYIKDINKIKVLIPSLNKQNKICNLLSGIENNINLEKDILNKFKLIKKYLLKNLFV